MIMVMCHRGWLILVFRMVQSHVRYVSASVLKSLADLTHHRKVTLRSPDSEGRVVLSAVCLRHRLTLSEPLLTPLLKQTSEDSSKKGNMCECVCMCVYVCECVCMVPAHHQCINDDVLWMRPW